MRSPRRASRGPLRAGHAFHACKWTNGVSGGYLFVGRARDCGCRGEQGGSPVGRTTNKVFATEVDHQGRSQSRGGPWTGSRHTFSGRKRNMHSPIMPTHGSSEPSLPAHGLSRPIAAAGGANSGANVSSFAAELRSGEHALEIEDPPGSPPAEVLDQMEAAGRICRQLLESGQRLRFSIEPEGGVKIELADREGKMRAVSPTEALDIAAGKSPE